MDPLRLANLDHLMNDLDLLNTFRQFLRDNRDGNLEDLLDFYLLCKSVHCEQARPEVQKLVKNIYLRYIKPKQQQNLNIVNRYLTSEVRQKLVDESDRLREIHKDNNYIDYHFYLNYFGDAKNQIYGLLGTNIYENFLASKVYREHLQTLRNQKQQYHHQQQRYQQQQQQHRPKVLVSVPEHSEVQSLTSGMSLMSAGKQNRPCVRTQSNMSQVPHPYYTNTTNVRPNLARDSGVNSETSSENYTVISAASNDKFHNISAANQKAFFATLTQKLITLKMERALQRCESDTSPSSGHGVTSGVPRQFPSYSTAGNACGSTFSNSSLRDVLKNKPFHIDSTDNESEAVINGHYAQVFDSGSSSRSSPITMVPPSAAMNNYPPFNNSYNMYLPSSSGVSSRQMNRNMNTVMGPGPGSKVYREPTISVTVKFEADEFPFCFKHPGASLLLSNLKEKVRAYKKGSFMFYFKRKATDQERLDNGGALYVIEEGGVRDDVMVPMLDDFKVIAEAKLRS